MGCLIDLALMVLIAVLAYYKGKGELDISWLWVTAPIWLLGLIAVFFLIAGMGYLYTKSKRFHRKKMKP